MSSFCLKRKKNALKDRENQLASYTFYYAEHATQARRHEDQRERMTSIILSIASIFIGLITFTKLSIWSLPAGIFLCLLGVFGFIFSGKLYERSRLHTEILNHVRAEIDAINTNLLHIPKTLTELRKEAESEHFEKFHWPRFSDSESEKQKHALSWIARKRLHIFWDTVHVIIFLIGLYISIEIYTKKDRDSEKENISKIQMISPIPQMEHSITNQIQQKSELPPNTKEK